MAIVVVGGHSRNVGKTSVAAAIIAALPERNWTAIKITQLGPGERSDGQRYGLADEAIAVSAERDAASGTDSSRYLAAGAVRSIWVRTRQGNLSEAMPRIRQEIALAENVIIESNSVLQFLRPDLYLMVLDPAMADFKTSARQYLDLADAVLLHSRAKEPPGNELPGEELRGEELRGTELPPDWSGVSLNVIPGKPQFAIAPPDYASADLIEFVRQRIS